MTHFIIKKGYRYKRNAAACLTPSTCHLFAVSLLFIDVPKLIFTLLDILKSAHIGFVQSVFYKLFVRVSTHDLFRASLASIGVARWIILRLTIMRLVAIAVFPSDQISIQSVISFSNFLSHTLSTRSL